MVGLIGAMAVELEQLKAQMENLREEKIGMDVLYTGTLFGQEVVLAVCGPGKVNAALCAQSMILRHHPRWILNLGVAGAGEAGVSIGDMVVASCTVQHDMDTSPLGDPVGYISGLGCVEMPCDAALCAALADAAARAGIEVRRGLVASGDQFIASAEQIARIRAHFDAQAAEMEGGAIGQVCTANGVPFAVLRAISDGGNEEAKMSYPQFVQRASERSVRILMEYLQA